MIDTTMPDHVNVLVHPPQEEEDLVVHPKRRSDPAKRYFAYILSLLLYMFTKELSLFFYKPGIKKVLKAQPTYSLIELEVNDRLGKKVRVKCAPNDLVGDFKKLVAAQIGTEPSKIVLKKWYKEFKDHITLADCK